MLDRFDTRAKWDGSVLVGWLDIRGEQVRFEASQEIIHRHAAGFNDALTWEIEKHADEIFAKLRRFFVRELDGR